ncbi:MAG: trehalose 6-phosphate synthase [Deltaproteobacteria bacterium]|nr:trehalose 6-phosphate synthase [Deltaproteobacteria bacterium]
MIQKQNIDTLRSFYDLMEKTRTVRAVIVSRLISSQPGNRKHIDALKNALASLKKRIRNGYKTDLILEGSDSIEVDLFYEIKELEKDVHYLQNGEELFLSYLESLHPDFSFYVKEGVKQLQDTHFNCFITDRDGTINNYCGRYRSSIQSVYNAVFLTRFVMHRTSHPIIITSAPLKGPGLMDVCTLPSQTVIYAASKGREFIDLAGVRRSFPIDTDKQQLIDRLNRRLKALVAEASHERFSLIGSGLQLKFGQTTIARQDINGSISEDRSKAFLDLIKSLVEEIDPTGENFKIEDTGLDVEIILTCSDQDGGLKDFDKKEAVWFLDRELNLHMENGPHLICGDTASDLPMLEAAMEKSTDTRSIFVTKDPQLAERVAAICPQALTVPEPDMLIAILNRQAGRMKREKQMVAQ